MRRLNGFSFYELGVKLRPLEDVRDETLYGDIFYDLHTARSAVREFLDSFQLKICRIAAEDLIEIIDSIVPNEWKDAIAKDQKATLDFRAYWIRKNKEAFENVVSAELNSLDTYLLTQQGIYNTADLVDHAENAFTKGTLAAISDEAKQDFQQGGRCLAFELPTASGFHTMRATEAVLREYHALAIKPTQPKPPEMAACINELRAQGEDPKLLNILDSIRDLHRNPQMHPEAFLSMDEAMRLFDISKSAINAMADRIAILQRTSTSKLVALAASAPAIAASGT